MLSLDISSLFSPRGDGNLLIVTVGNQLRSDDGVGPYIAARLHPARTDVIVRDVGERPEDILDDTREVRPAATVFIDAADFGGRPGEVRIIPPEEVSDVILSTHSFPLIAVAKILADETGSDSIFLGIQPVTVAFGEGLSPAVRETAELLVELINGGGSIDA